MLNYVAELVRVKVVQMQAKFKHMEGLWVTGDHWNVKRNCIVFFKKKKRGYCKPIK